MDQAFHLVNHRIGSEVALQLTLCEACKHGRIAGLAAKLFAHAHAARTGHTVEAVEGHHPLVAQLELFVETGEITRVDRHHDHAGKVAIRSVDAPGQLDRPLAGGAPQHRRRHKQSIAAGAHMHLEVLPVRQVKLAGNGPIGKAVNALRVDDAHLWKNFCVDHALCGQRRQVKLVTQLEVTRLDEANDLVGTAKGPVGVLLADAGQVGQVAPGIGEFFGAAVVHQGKHVPPGQAQQHGCSQPKQQHDAAVMGNADRHGRLSW